MLLTAKRNPNVHIFFVLAILTCLIIFSTKPKSFRPSQIWPMQRLQNPSTNDLLTSSSTILETITSSLVSITETPPSTTEVPPEPLPTSSSPPPVLNGTFSRVLVMGHKKDEDVGWVHETLPDLNNTLYVVDDPASKNSIPANKGHEAMVYLTYIIDHYNALPDVILFYHPHQYAWHNNILLDLSSPASIDRLSSARVIRLGYVNIRCHLDPGCPRWLRLDVPESDWDLDKHREERYFTTNLWKELYPNAPFPEFVSQPCCAQFAVSGERVRQIPRQEFIRLRDWLLHTTLEDEISGRIMEYTWQYIFTGEFEVCPSQHDCYCDGYGICFPGGDEGLNDWLNLLSEYEGAETEMNELLEKKQNEEDVEVLVARAKKERLGELVEKTKRWAYERGDEMRRRAIEEGKGSIV